MTGVQIDPRIRARRIEVRRHAGRRRLRRVIDIALLLAVAAGFAVALRTPLLDVEAVRIAGAGRVGEAAVAEAAGIAPGDQLIDLDLGAVGRRIAALPWIAEATVHRGLDGTVRIEVLERTPAALVGDGDEAVLVDAGGHVVARAADNPDLAGSLVRVTGAPDGLAPGDDVGADAVEALVLAARLAEDLPGAVAQVELGDELLATLTAGGTVRFGSAERLGAKVRALATMLAQVDLVCLGELDLRVPGSPVLTREEPCS